MVATTAVKTEPSSLSAMAFSGLEITSAERDSPVPSHLGFEQDAENPSNYLIKSRIGPGTVGAKSSHRRRSKVQKEHIVSTAVTNMDPQPPTPLSPVASFPEGRIMHLPRGNINVKQETIEPSISALATPTSASAHANSIAFYDMLSMATSTNAELMFGQHHRVLSATSQDSRGGHCIGSVTSPVSKSVPHGRCSSSSSNSNHIVSSLSAPRKEGFPMEYQVVNTSGTQDPVISSRVGNNTKSNSSTHTSPDPDVEANADIETSTDLNEVSPSAINDEDEESDTENSRPATCPHCSKEFQSKGLLRSHVVSHSSDRPFVCWDCTDKSYKRNHDLLRHRREKHNVDGAVAPSRGSGRNSRGVREATVDRITHQPTIASQNLIPHRDIIYPTHAMMYLGSRGGGGGLQDLSPPSSGSPLDPYGGMEYVQHNHGHPLYSPHSQTNADLGMELEMSTPKTQTFKLKLDDINFNLYNNNNDDATTHARCIWLNGHYYNNNSEPASVIPPSPATHTTFRGI
ncbi:hypothetical protein BGZ80_001381 [Entomortierella chlamydospora]|uniref:C2H2-type domain-containing protein n=1 Tax=Entomortierella chlamydospora TaxID=101097 RepID=A0A9P6N1Q5_9FUNG|nr:hypothetical protein BGZ80_001381 [Entomortierella chlamydospora]